MGFIVTDRHAENYSNTVAGVDGNIRLGKSDRIEMQLIRSYSEYPTQIQTDFDQKPEINDNAYLLNYSHNDDHWHWGMRYTEYGDDFRADMGFINRVDFRRLNLSGGHNWRFGPEKKFHRIYFGGDWEKSYDEAGNELEEEIGIGINAEGPLQSYIYMGFSQRER